MGYKNYVPKVYIKRMQKELDRTLVGKEDCTLEYEGEVKKVGDSVKILAAGDVSLRRFSDGNLHTLGTPEVIDDTALNMPIKEVADFDFMVDDLGDKQSIVGLDKRHDKAARKMANDMDKFIFSAAADKEAFKYPGAIPTLDETNVMDYLDKALVMLYKKDVQPTDDIIITGTPDFIRVLRKAYVHLDTNNSKLLKNGFVGMYFNAKVKMSNNVFVESGNEHIMIRTPDALAFANPFLHTEAKRAPRNFGDIVSGYCLFDKKWVRPQESVILRAKF